MKKSRTIPRNRTFRVQVAKATKQKQESLRNISVPGECVSSSDGFERSREKNPTRDEQGIEVTKDKPGDSCAVISSESKKKLVEGITSARISDDEDWTKLTTLKNSADKIVDCIDSTSKINEPTMSQNIAGLNLDVKSKPLIDYSSLIYKNYPKKIAGIKVTKKFLLMSKGLKWKARVTGPEIKDSTNKEVALNQGAITRDVSSERTADLTIQDSSVDEKTFIETSDVATPQTPVTDKDSKCGLQIVKSVCCSQKQKKSNLKSIMSKYSPKPCIKWHPNEPSNFINKPKSSSNPHLKSVDRHSPANIGYHNSSQAPKPGLYSDSSDVSNQTPDYKNAFITNSFRKRSHIKARSRTLHSQVSEYDQIKKPPCMRKKSRGQLKLSKENIHRPFIPSRIPVSINKSLNGAGSYGNFLQHNNALCVDRGFSNCTTSLHKISRKPSVGKQAMKISFDRQFLERDVRPQPQETSAHKFAIINRFSPQCMHEIKLEEPTRRDSSRIDLDDNVQDNVQSLNKHYRTHSILQKNRDDNPGCNLWIEKTPLSASQHKLQLTQNSFEAMDKKMQPDSLLDKTVDDDVQELQNLINQHKQNGANLNSLKIVKSKADIYGSNVNKSIAQDSLVKDMKILRTSYPFQSLEMEKEPNKFMDTESNLEMNRNKQKSFGESMSGDNCLTTMTSKLENLNLASKKEINKVFKMFLKKQDAELKNNLLKYLMEESEKNALKEKNSVGILSKKKSKPSLKNTCSRSSSRNSVSLTRRKRWESGESSKSSSKSRVGSSSRLRRAESVSPLRNPKRCSSKSRESLRRDFYNRSDTSLFAEKARTYKNLYSNSREMVNLASDTSIAAVNIIPPCRSLTNNSFIREDSPSRRFAEASFKSEKPFRSWLKSNNLIVDEFRETSPNEPSPRLEDPLVYQKPDHGLIMAGRDKTDISHLFSSSKNYANDSHFVDSQFYGFSSSPTEYFFNSLSQAGVNNNNTKSLPLNMMQNLEPQIKDVNKLHSWRTLPNNFQGKTMVRESNANDPCKKIMASLNRRHTKKPIKMSILPCSWPQESVGFPARTLSTLNSQCSSASLCPSRRVGWRNCLEKKHSYSLISPETIRSMSFSSDRSSLKLMRSNHTRAAFH